MNNITENRQRNLIAPLESQVYFRIATATDSHLDNSPQYTAVIRLRIDIITPDPNVAPTDNESGCLFMIQNAPTANKTLINPVTSNWKPTTAKCRRNIDVRQKQDATPSCATKLKFIAFLGFKIPSYADWLSIRDTTSANMFFTVSWSDWSICDYLPIDTISDYYVLLVQHTVKSDIAVSHSRGNDNRYPMMEGEGYVVDRRVSVVWETLLLSRELFESRIPRNPESGIPNPRFENRNFCQDLGSWIFESGSWIFGSIP